MNSVPWLSPSAATIGSSNFPERGGSCTSAWHDGKERYGPGSSTTIPTASSIGWHAPMPSCNTRRRLPSASPAAAQRDVACLLSAYAARPGVDVVDPDDVGACPLRELGLVLRHDAVNRFERARRPQAVPLEAFLACCSALSDDLGKGALSLRELATSRGGPGRVFCMGMDAIEEMIGHVGSQQWIRDASVETSAGERHLVIGPREPADWLDALYDRVARRDVR
jgi:hypothetical protein